METLTPIRCLPDYGWYQLQRLDFTFTTNRSYISRTRPAQTSEEQRHLKKIPQKYLIRTAWKSFVRSSVANSIKLYVNKLWRIALGNSREYVLRFLACSSSSGTTPKGGAQGGRAARALKRTSRGETLRTSTRATPPRGKLGNQRSEGHNHNQGHGLDDEEVLGDMPQSPGKRTETDTFAMRKKRKTARLVLTDEQEEGLVEWLQSSPELFDKSHRRYKDIDLKSNLWEQKADMLGVESGEVLQVWYKSMRTRFGKLRRITSVGRKREFTWRDQWILKKFAFISPHIYACPNRGTHPTTGFVSID